MPKVHIFNPETDYALAVGDNPYTPASSMLNVCISNSQIPFAFAGNDDIVAVRDSIYPLVIRNLTDNGKNNLVATVRLSQLPELIKQGEWEIHPWGWNHSLRRELIRVGVPETMLKSNDELNQLRTLSHRRTTLEFYRLLDKSHVHFISTEPREFSNIDQAMAYAERYSWKVWFKMPWSSSGRGVLNGVSIKPDSVREWVLGCIQKQGSVIAELHIDKRIDFASEWEISNGNAIFKGFSLFSTDKNGHYFGNDSLSQNEIVNIIESNASYNVYEIRDCQKNVLETLIAPHYNGPLGIDMMIDLTGGIVPCVEINLRKTMGMVALEKNRQ